MRARLAFAGVAVACAFAATFVAVAAPADGVVIDPNGVINLRAGYSYTVLSTACEDSVTSTESGVTYPMPEDFDGNILFNAGDELWLLNNHELTEPRPGDFQGDAGKCAVPEQTPASAPSRSRLPVTKTLTARVRCPDSSSRRTGRPSSAAT
jgi:hypothetical protein